MMEEVFVLNQYNKRFKFFCCCSSLIPFPPCNSLISASKITFYYADGTPLYKKPTNQKTPIEIIL